MSVCPGCYPGFMAQFGENLADKFRWLADHIEALGVSDEQRAEVDDVLRELREVARMHVEDAAHAQESLDSEPDERD